MPEKIEQILKAIHLLFAYSEKNSVSKENITVNKKELFGLLEQLNYAIIEVMDMYEMNEVKKDQAKHKVELEGQKIMDDASRSAEEIYAASIMYTDDALVELKKIMREAKENILHEYDIVGDRIDKQIRMINTNKDELNLQLQEMQYGKEYLRILEEEKKRKNKEEEKKRASEKSKVKKTNSPENHDEDFEEEHIKSDIVINVNKSHPSVIKAEIEKHKEQEKDSIDDEELPVIQIYKPEDLDAEFFAWKEEHESLEEQEVLEVQEMLEEHKELEENNDKIPGKISSLKKKVTKLLT